MEARVYSEVEVHSARLAARNCDERRRRHAHGRNSPARHILCSCEGTQNQQTGREFLRRAHGTSAKIARGVNQNRDRTTQMLLGQPHFCACTA